MSAATATRWARAHVAFGVVSLLAWRVAVVAGAPHATAVVLAVYGFVAHTVFGKAYALVPSYFSRSLDPTWTPAVSLVTAGTGTSLLALGTLGVGAGTGVAAAGAVLWAAGAVAFAGTLAWTVRDDVTGAETGTGEHNAERRGVDRAANAVVPFVLAYLLAGAVETVSVFAGGPALAGVGRPGAVHLLAVGVGALLVFAVGARLFPRLRVASPPSALVYAVLAAGTVGPALLVAGFGGGPLFVAGAVSEAVAVVGFALVLAVLAARSDRDRVGLSAPLVGALAGSAGVALGVHFALGGFDAALVSAHFRLNVAGFLTLTIVGASYSFYPPSVAPVPRGDALGRGVVAGLTLGLAAEVVGLVASVPSLVVAGEVVSMVAAGVHALLVLGAFYARPT